MRLNRPLIVLASVGAALALGAPAAIGASPRADRDVASATGSRFVPGEAIVRFERGTTPSERLAARRGADVELDRALRISQAQVVDVEGSVAAAVRALERQPEVEYAQPNFRYRASAAPAPNDTFFPSLWGFSDPALPNPGVDALEAWESEPTRGAGQVVAVVDTGVAFDHPDLVGSLWFNDDPPGGGDEDANGKVDDFAGYDFVDDDADPDDYNSHGTHVAGTIAATADNALGIAGVAPGARIMPVRVLDGDGTGFSDAVGDGIAYAAREGADVINLSLGFEGSNGEHDEFLADAATEADARDVVVVASAGNAHSDNDAAPTEPCTLPQPNIVCVAAVNPSGGLASFSNFGATTVDLGAPGTSILSTETDYEELMSDSFDVEGIPGWSKEVFSPGSLEWGSSTTSSDGGLSAADSAGAGQTYAPSSDTQLVTTDPVDLSGRRGCRMSFDLRYDIDDVSFDALFAGAVAAGAPLQSGIDFWGSSNGMFEPTEVSISGLDGRADVHPVFALFSDEEIERGGAEVDDLKLLCRDSTYSNAPPPAGNYVSFNGTSMAAPHVAGVAALVRAADPAAPDTEVVQALAQGTSPLPALICKTVTGGVADADAAIAAALALPSGSASAPGTCPPGGPPLPPPPPVSPTPPTSPAPPPLVSPPPGVPPNVVPPQIAPSLSLLGSRSRIRVSRRGRFSYALKATPGLVGEAVFRTRRKAFVARRAHVTVARKRFASPRSGPTVVRIRLSRRKLAILRGNRRLLLLVSVTARDSAGRSVEATKRMTLLAPRL